MLSLRRHWVYLVSALFILLTAQSYAEVYRWVDSDGNVHFGDRPPAKSQPAKEISADLENNNIDSSRKQRQGLNSTFAKETKSEQQQKQRQQQENQQAQNKRCQKARYRLRVYDGPVVLVDKQGKDLKLTEVERRKREQAARAEVQKYCS